MVVASEHSTAVLEARAGNPAAWDQLFRRYQLPLYAYVFEMVREEQTSLDVVQETFISACRHLDTLAEDAKFGSWLFGIAHQKCLQRWRARKRDRLVWDDQEALPEEAPSADEDPGDRLLRQEQEESFMALIEHLSPPHRAVLLLHYLEEFPLAEIAAITGSSLGTVKSRLHYAKKALRELLAQADLRP